MKRMTRKELQTMQNSIDKEKIRKADQYIFEYLAKEGFTLFEAKYLSASMIDILRDMKKNDSSRLVKEFNYSSSADNVFSDTAISNTES